MTKFLEKIVVALLGIIPLTLFVRVVRKSIDLRLSKEPARTALGSLLALDNFVYTQTSKFASVLDEKGHAKHRLTGYIDHFAALAAGMEGPYLDVGCGNGALANALAVKVAQNVVGIDIVPERVEVARLNVEAPNASFISGDAVSLDLEEQFSTIILSNVLEHIEERPLFLQSLQHKYAPRNFLIRVPNFERDWRVPLKKELGIEWRSDITHFTEHTEAALEQELREAGLSILEKEIRWGEIWVIARSAQT